MIEMIRLSGVPEQLPNYLYKRVESNNPNAQMPRSTRGVSALMLAAKGKPLTHVLN